ncbi:MAG: hypothetical protein ACREME_01490 [Gemmatimonadales bacterium]
MKRILMVVALAAFAVTPAAAQLSGMPVWNSPKGGTGVTISGDYASNNDDAGGGSAFGVRASLGLANLTLGAGVASYDSDVLTDKVTSFGATAGFRIIGGSLIPVALNLQVGVGRTGEFDTGADTAATTTLTGALGLAVSVPTPGVSIEPYLSLGMRSRSRSGESDSNFGWTLGANANFGMFGLHLAYDSESLGGGQTSGILGIGAHVALRAPIGM